MRLTLLLSLLLFLAGCVFTESVFTVNKDNSVDFTFIKKISKELAAEIEENPTDVSAEDSLRYTELGMVISRYEDDYSVGTQIQRHYKTAGELNQIPLLADSTALQGAPMIRESAGQGHTLWTVSYRPNIRKMLAGGGGQPDADVEEMLDTVESVLNNKVTWKVPFEVVATNAKIRNDSLGVYTWEFEGAQGDSIYLQYKVPRGIAVSALKLLSVKWLAPTVGLLALLAFLLLRKKKPREEVYRQIPKETPTPPPDDQP